MIPTRITIAVLAYGNKEDYVKAIADYETALKIDPNNANAKRGIEQAKQARGY